MKNYFNYSLLIIIALFAACQTIENEAERITINDLNSNKVNGFEWFKIEYDDYTIHQDFLQNIKNKYDPNIYKFIIFASPSCSCGKEYRKFPQFVKILDSSKVAESNYEIYSVGDIDFSQPYEEVFTLKALPTFIIMKEGIPVYSVNDTILKYTSMSLEKALEEGLQK